MSLTAQTARTGLYTISALPATLSAVFPFQQASDLLVLNMGQGATPNDPPLILSLNSDYTVTGGGYNVAHDMQSGNVVVAAGGANDVQVGDQIIILRIVPVNQAVSFVTGVYTPAMLEAALDKQATLSQELKEAISRTLRYEGGETLDGTLLNRASRASHLLGFDAAGLPTYYAQLGAGGGTVGVGYGLLLVGTTVSVNSAVVPAYSTTIAALKAISVTALPNNYQVMVGGYYATGDGGGGLFYYDSGSAAADNGGTVIQPTAGAGRWLRQNPANFINVREFGAKGDGTTDDITAINAAIAALPADHATLFFPPGKYRFVASVPTGFSGKTYLTITGLGAEIYNCNHGNTFVLDPTCSKVTVTGLRFTGDASVRANGIHIRCHASDSDIINNYFSGCSDFGVFLGYDDTAAICANICVEANIFEATLGDGIHVMKASDVVIADNIFTATGDDSIALVADVLGANPLRVSITGNIIYNSAFRGIAVLEATDVLIEGNTISTTVGAAIETGRANSTAYFNTRISVVGNKIYNSTTSAGPRGAINMQYCDFCRVSANSVVATANGNGISFLDSADMMICGNFLKGAQSRGIGTDDATTANVRANWNRVFITNNEISTTTNQGIYIVPAATLNINSLQIAGNVGTVIGGGDFIYWDRITTGRVFNNLNDGGNTYTAGGTVAAVTAGNNN